jgi:8-oxo-dGTP pyrophosphatase MutT (NUDIX family)
MGNKTRPTDIPDTTKPPKVSEKGSIDAPRKEASFGVIPLKFVFENNEKGDPRDADSVQVLLVTLVSGGHVSFPKGHAELIDGKMETAMQAAKRELWEETGLEVDDFLLKGESAEEDEMWEQGQGVGLERVTCGGHDGHWTITEYYKFEHAKKGWIEKTCTYFLATVKGDVQVQPEEIVNFTWAEFLEPEVTLPTFEASKQVWKLARGALARSWFGEMIAGTTHEVLTEVDELIRDGRFELC